MIFGAKVHRVNLSKISLFFFLFFFTLDNFPNLVIFRVKLSFLVFI